MQAGFRSACSMYVKLKFNGKSSSIIEFSVKFTVITHYVSQKSKNVPIKSMKNAYSESNSFCYSMRESYQNIYNCRKDQIVCK